METYLDFEKPIQTLEKKLQELRELQKEGASNSGFDLSDDISNLEKKVSALIQETYSNLLPWQRVQVSRHPNRPYAEDFIHVLFPDFLELHGDRLFGDDAAIVAGVATFEGEPVIVIGQQKGRSTKQKMERNFGMARPEGYRKAMRMMDIAERMKLPLIALVDTPGAFPGMDAEERGQAQAIAEGVRRMLALKTPTIALIIGEGGSGGALALAVADHVMMLEYSTYSVISPESCASILWSDSTLASRASEKLKMHADELMKCGIIDEVIPEPLGGAHRNWNTTFKNVEAAISRKLEALTRLPDAKRMGLRAGKFRKMGCFAIQSTASSETPARKPKAAKTAKAKSKTKSTKKAARA